MPKGTAFSRVVEYFRTADLTEAKSCLEACANVITSRDVPAAPKQRRRRRRTADETPEQTNAATA